MTTTISAHNWTFDYGTTAIEEDVEAFDSGEILTIIYIIIGVVGITGNGLVVFAMSYSISLR